MFSKVFAEHFVHNRFPTISLGTVSLFLSVRQLELNYCLENHCNPSLFLYKKAEVPGLYHWKSGAHCLDPISKVDSGWYGGRRERPKPQQCLRKWQWKVSVNICLQFIVSQNVSLTFKLCLKDAGFSLKMAQNNRRSNLIWEQLSALVVKGSTSHTLRRYKRWLWHFLAFFIRLTLMVMSMCE